MAKEVDYGDLNAVVKEFLKYNGYKSTFECFEAEEKTKMVSGKLTKKELNIIPKVILACEFRTLTTLQCRGCTGCGRTRSRR